MAREIKDNMNATPNDSPSFLSRMLANDTLRRGVAGAIAGVLVAAVSEALWPEP